MTEGTYIASTTGGSACGACGNRLVGVGVRSMIMHRFVGVRSCIALIRSNMQLVTSPLHRYWNIGQLMVVAHATHTARVHESAGAAGMCAIGGAAQGLSVAS